MAETDPTPAAADVTYPEGYVDGELAPELHTDFQVDSAAYTSKHPKKQAEARKKQVESGKKEKKDGLQNLKSALIISGVVVAVVGAIFAVAKKIREA